MAFFTPSCFAQSPKLSSTVLTMTFRHSPSSTPAMAFYSSSSSSFSNKYLSPRSAPLAVHLLSSRNLSRRCWDSPGNLAGSGPSVSGERIGIAKEVSADLLSDDSHVYSFSNLKTRSTMLMTESVETGENKYAVDPFPVPEDTWSC